MINVNYIINGETVTHKFPKYYECDKDWFQNAVDLMDSYGYKLEQVLDKENYLFIKQ